MRAEREFFRRELNLSISAREMTGAATPEKFGSFLKAASTNSRRRERSRLPWFQSDLAGCQDLAGLIAWFWYQTLPGMEHHADIRNSNRLVRGCKARYLTGRFNGASNRQEFLSRTPPQRLT